MLSITTYHNFYIEYNNITDYVFYVYIYIYICVCARARARVCVYILMTNRPKLGGTVPNFNSLSYFTMRPKFCLSCVSKRASIRM